MIKVLRERLKTETNQDERKNIIDMIEMWERKLDIEPKGVNHLLTKKV